MRIAYLSTFYPFRGGISQFNARLLGELGKSHTVQAFTFKRQYPDFLFPGKTQKVGPDDNVADVGAIPVLDTANPLSYPAAARAIRAFQPDILIMKYWMSYFAPSLGYVSRRLKGSCKVIPILDNVIPHEQHFFDKPLTRYFLSGASGCVSMSAEVDGDLLSLGTGLPHTVIPHPVYDHFGESIPREEAEKRLGLAPGRKNLLFFGLIRKYKGLDILLEAFRELPEDYQLIIAGESYGPFDEYQAIIDSLPGKERIKVFNRYIPDEEVKVYFSAADLAVLPYRSATQSGISATAVNFGVPVVVTDVGGLRETVGERGSGLVAPAPEPSLIRDAVLEYFASPELQSSLKSSISEEKYRLSWAGFCTSLLQFAQSIDK